MSSDRIDCLVVEENDPSDNLKTFLSKQIKISSVSLRSGISNVMSAFVGPANASDQEVFSKDVSELVSSDKFLSELAEEINDPLPGESEEDFVNRASEILRRKLYRSLSLK